MQNSQMHNDAAPLQAVILDFDGTLAALTIDFAAMGRAVRALAATYMDPMPADGIPVLEWLDRAVARLSETDARAARRLRRHALDLIQDEEIKAADAGRLFPDALEALGGLKAAGLAVGIVTRNCERAVRLVFPEAPEPADLLLARDHVDRVKPDPVHLLAALDRLGVPADRALVVGDHPMDVETARRVGAMACAVPTGNTPEDRLRKAGPDIVAPCCGALPGLLRRMGLLPQP